MTSPRYFIGDNERLDGVQYRFVYDRQYKRFVTVQVYSSQGWSTVKKANDENFYVYFPGFANQLRESNSLPKWPDLPRGARPDRRAFKPQ